MRMLLCAALLMAACTRNAPEARPPAPPAPSQTADLTGAVVARGEPQWRLDINRETGMSLALDEGAQTWTAAYVAPERTAQGYRFASGDLTVELETAPCTSERAEYPMTAVVQAPGREPLNGCAAERWDAHLLELMPEIDACIAAAPEARRVSYAAARGDGYFVRLRSESGGIDCSVGANGVVQISLRDETTHIGGENEALFVRAPGANPGGECFEAPEVRDPSGDLLGWMDDPHGC